MARTYKRDANGRFAGGGGSTRSGRPAAKPVSRGKNRITRDNAGRIASVGGEGATARGGRLRTAAGNKRAVQTARIKGAGGKLRKPMGGGGAAQPAAKAAAPSAQPSRQSVKSKSSKRTAKSIDSAKVERILGRVQQSPAYQGRTRRLLAAKQSAGADTRRRAADFLSKQAGLQPDGTSMGRKRWKAPEGMTQQQMKQNIADSLPKQSRKSTARTGNKKLVTRAQKRDEKIQERLNPARVSYVFGREAPKPSTPKRLSQGYDGGTARGSKVLARAASRQRARRRVTEALAGTGRLMRPAAKLQRGRAGQRSLLGGRATTYGRLRRR
jgi:hypothetical protein